MKKENDISFFDFLDFEVFALPEKKTEFSNKNNKPAANILIIFYNEKNDPELEVLLKNILSAAKLDFDKDIVLLKTTPQARFSFSEIQKKMPLKDLLFFGINPSNFGLNYSIKPYQPLTINKLRILSLDSLEEVNTDVNKKKALWSCLKEMYL
jgi:hypothetical protein